MKKIMPLMGHQTLFNWHKILPTVVLCPMAYFERVCIIKIEKNFFWDSLMYM